MAGASPSLDLEALRRHEAWLRPMVRALVGDDAANDVLQQTWLRAWQRPPRASRAASAWLLRVATRFALSHRRADARRRRHEAAVEADTLAPSTAETVERLSVHRAVSAAVSELAEPYRTTVLLRHYHGLSVDEVVERTGTSPANVRQRLHRGLQSMRQRLEAELGSDWRRAPAVLALALPTAAVVAPAAIPLLMTMNKLRLAVVLVCMLGTVGLGSWLWQSSASRAAEAPAAAPAIAAASPTTPLAAPPHQQPSAPIERTAAVAAATAAPAASLRVDVLDGLGRPVGDVSFGVRSLDGEQFQTLGRSDDTGRADTTLPWPIGVLEAAPPWVALAVRPASADAAARSPLLVVAHGQPLDVTVQDENGAPIASCSLVLRAHGIVDFPQPLDDANQIGPTYGNADAAGHHHWDLVPIASTTLNVQRAGYLPWTGAIDDTTPPQLTVTLRAIRKGASVVSGVVTDARGALVVGATVGLGERRAKTDRYGGYTLSIEPGADVYPQQRLFAVQPGWYPAIVEDFGARLTGVAGLITQDLQLTRPSVTIAGRVVDDQGRPQVGVNVYPWQVAGITDHESAEDLAAPHDRRPLLLSGNPVRAFGCTDAEGHFTVPGLDRRPYRLHVYDAATGCAWTTGEIVGGEQQALVSLPPDLMGAVGGVAVARDGSPAAGLELTAFVEVHSRDGGSASVGIPVTAKTDAQGRFHIDRMPRYGVSLSLSAADWITQSVTLVPTTSTTELCIVVLRRCHVRVQLDDAKWATASISFHDLDDAVVSIHGDHGNLHMTTANYALHEGKSGVLSLSDDATSMVVQAANGEQMRVPISLQPGHVTLIER